MFLYLFNSETNEYVGKKEAVLDEFTTKCKGSESYWLEPCSTFVEPELKEGYICVWNGSGWEYKEPPTLYELKDSKINKFKSIRDALEVKPIEYNDNFFDFDEKARDRINSAIIALDVSKGQIAWTTADNTEVMVNADDLRGVVAAMALRSNELHVKYRKLKEQVEACSTKEELQKIVWE